MGDLTIIILVDLFFFDLSLDVEFFRGILRISIVLGVILVGVCC